MKRLLLLALLPILAHAGDATLSWAAPTTNTDGSAIPASGSLSIASYKVEYFQCASITSTWPATPTSVSVTGLTKVVTGLTENQRYCFRVSSVNVAGTSSVPSNVGTKLIPVTTPNPPVLTVVDTVAYKMRQSVDGFQLVAIGTVPLGTPCVSGSAVNGMNIVPRNAVVKSNKYDVLPLTVYASCG